jgi:Tfp pilus assembly protein PilZ
MKLRNTLLTAAFFAAAPFMQAASITTTLNAINPNTPSQGTFVGGGFNSVYAGVLNFTSTAYLTFDAFCIEPNESISLGQTVTYNIEALNSPERIQVARVMAVYLASDRSSLQAQGAQWAIWELLLDNKIDLSKNVVKLPAGRVREFANTYLTTFENYAPADNLVWLTSDNIQDMVAIVPEPSAALIGGIGILLMLRRRRRVCN